MAADWTTPKRIKINGEWKSNLEYNRKYYQDHKKEIKQYRLGHKEERKEYDKEYFQKNKERIYQYRKQLIRNKRKEILRLLGNKCIYCGNDDVRVLQIDHANGGGRKEKLRFKNNSSSYYNFVLKKIKEGSKDYQLLCANYNWIKKYENGEK